MLFSNAVAWAAFAAVCSATSALSSHEIHEKRSIGHSLWRRGQRLDSNSIIPVRIGLTQSNLENGYAHLMNVASPSSPNFGKHWTADEVHSMFAPSDETVRNVTEWLIASGIKEDKIVQSENNGWIAMNLPAQDAERLFQTEYHEHEHTDKGRLKVGCDEYSIPQHLQPHIDYVTPGVRLSSLLKKRTVKHSDLHSSGHNHGHGHAHRGHNLHSVNNGSHPYPPQHPGWRDPSDMPPWQMPANATQLPSDLQTCGVNITSACIRALYDIPVAHLTDSVNSLGIFEQGGAFAQADLDEFYAASAPQIPAGTGPIIDSVDGGVAPSNQSTAQLESDIDFQMALQLIFPQTTILYQVNDVPLTDDNTTNTSFLESFLDSLDGSFCVSGGNDSDATCGNFAPTRVISVSYSIPEFVETVAYSQRACNEFMKLGLQGVTVMFASGDFGVADHGGECLSSILEDGFTGNNQIIFVPQFPDTCPFITAVGATQLNTNDTVNDPESAMNQPTVGLSEQIPGSPPLTFSSSGGFSNFFKAPEYQQKALDTYFAAHNPPYKSYVSNGINPADDGSNIGANSGIFNAAGRGIPDVSANGVNFLVFNQGAQTQSFGTSLAAPLWAAIITLINEERTAVGKGPVGFINPVLYENAAALHDITKGSNPGCFTDGFEAVEGWDPVTGLGTPDFPSLLKLFMGLP